MIYARLERPEVLEVDGKEYRAGELTPLLKGQAQQLVKALRREGIDAGFTYEDQADDNVRGRYDVGDQDNDKRDASIERSAGAKGRGQGGAKGGRGKRSRRGNSGASDV